jgi:3',5'-cyclic AMP phosphodiesterase CpdA
MLIAQLSDLHVRPRGILYEGLVDSNAMAEAAIRHLGQLVPAPDLVIVSGDLVDDGTPAAYAVVHEMLAAIRQPVLLIPGNHDEREAFRRAFAPAGYLPEAGPLHFVASDHGPVRVIGLDVTIPGAHHGLFDDPAADWLADALAREPDRPTLVMMHQPPFSSCIPFIDIYRCHGAERLASIVSAYPAIERVVCGHVHRFMQLRFAGTMLCTAPSTTTAIALRLAPDAAPASFVEPPAFLLHHWQPTRGLVTHYVPIGSFPGPMPFA